MLRVLALVCLATLLAGTAQAQSCSQADIAHAAAAVAAARADLEVIPFPDLAPGSFPDTDIKPPAQIAVTTMKVRLAKLIAAYMRCAPARIGAAKIASDLEALGHAISVEEPDHYGQALSFTAEGGRIVTVDAGFDIPCTWDTCDVDFYPHNRRLARGVARTVRA
jgi:hypothetical protein